MNKIKMIGLLLAVVTLLGVLASCRNNADDPVSSGSTNESDNSGDVSESQSGGNESSDIPTPIMSDFGGYKFRVLTRGSGGWRSDDITGEVTGNKISAATHKRNAQLEQKYNFKIVEDKQKDWLNVAQTVSSAQEDVYDMFSFKLKDMPSLGQNGYIYNLNDVDGLNLDADYYDQSTRQQGSFANYLFFLTGDMLFMDDGSTSIMMYNASIWDDLQLTDVYGKNLYQLVEDKEWTLEKLKVLSGLATGDNGDGVWDEKDNYGCAYENVNTLSFNVALGNQLLLKDSDDIFYLNDSTKVINDLESIFEFFNSGDCMKNIGIFSEGKALFSTFWAAGLTNNSELLNSGVDFGVIPTPMNDEDQDVYYSMITAYGSNCITICSTVSDIDKTANIIELISYESKSTLTPAVEEYLLEARSVSRAEDLEMIRICFSNKLYELCYTWETGSLYSTMTALNDANGEGISSAMSSCKDAVNASVQRKLERLNQLS